jgi:hypothetical protein
LNSTVRAIAVTGPDVYAGGDFYDLSGNADYIARWDGSSWNALGSGSTLWVYSSTVVGPDVYAGGHFTDMGGNPAADHIARWGTKYYYAYLPMTKKP